MRDRPTLWGNPLGYNAPRSGRAVREGSVPRVQTGNSIFMVFSLRSGRISNSAMDLEAWLERGQGGEMNPCGGI